MALHLLKLSVGIESVAHLRRVQDERLRANGRLFHITRFRPRRAEEIVGAGSIYWVIRHAVRVRQPISAFERVRNPETGDEKCAIILDPALVETEPQPRRPHQGWRYLTEADAPADIPAFAAAEHEPPPEMAAELRALGLL